MSVKKNTPCILNTNCNTHCESGKEPLLQGEVALQMSSFRDAEPQLVSHQKKINHGVPPVQLRPGKNICLTTIDPSLTIIAWK